MSKNFRCPPPLPVNIFIPLVILNGLSLKKGQEGRLYGLFSFRLFRIFVRSLGPTNWEYSSIRQLGLRELSLPRNLLGFPNKTPVPMGGARGTVRVKCLSQKQYTMFPAKARTQTAPSGVERTNHEATAPPVNRQQDNPVATLIPSRGSVGCYFDFLLASFFALPWLKNVSA